MAVSYPIFLFGSSWEPTLKPIPASIELQAEAVGGLTASPFTLAQQSYEWSGQRWRLSVRYPAMKRAMAMELIASLASLRGRVGRFYFGPCGDERIPRGAFGAGLATGVAAGQTGSTLAMTGLTPSISGMFKAGDYFMLENLTTSRLHMVMEDANTNGSGATTLEIWPPHRTATLAGGTEPLNTDEPYGIFRLRGPAQWNVGLASVYGLSFEAEEAF